MPKVGDMSWVLHNAERLLAALKKKVHPKSIATKALFTVVEIFVYTIAGLLSLVYILIFLPVLKLK
jgi:hypothetical protein